MPSSGVDSVLGQRRRRWADIEPTLGGVSCLMSWLSILFTILVYNLHAYIITFFSFLNHVNDCVVDNVRVYHGYFFLSVHNYYIFKPIMFIMFIRNASPHLIFHDLVIILFSWQPFVPVDPKMIYSHDNISFLFTSYFVYMFSSFHLIFVNLNMKLKVKLYDVKYLFLTYQYVNCRFIAEASWRTKR